MFDNLDKCEKCGGEHLIANDIWGKPKDFHKIPSPRFEGYFTFQEGCVEEVANV